MFSLFELLIVVSACLLGKPSNVYMPTYLKHRGYLNYILYYALIYFICVSSDCSAQDKTYNMSSATASVFVPVGLTKPLVLETKEVEMTVEQNMSGEMLHDPDLFLYEYATMYASAPGIKKDPFHMNPMIHDAWLEKCDVEFKQWLNAVLTPPEELDAVEVTKVDAANLWARSTKAGANQELAPSREKVSSRYLAVKVSIIAE
jgi:hypothetical protein